MAFMLSLGTLFYVGLLFINAIAVLHEERFLARSKSTEAHMNKGTLAEDYREELVGLGPSSSQGFGDQSATVKYKVINLISAIRTLLRFPLVAINIVVIAYELIFG
ncbi:hypothetical protein PhCBS80983_g02880 [Powellomyces hirtus]|uniref:Yos1-like protein n=1 Tax=Powellomyces hirtus TaxID=109895 RepID=A0A507E695_9FUNG|nr:hypothetical protein PhCBS80983_g02880 [Powellomyces hirtus]